MCTKVLKEKKVLMTPHSHVQIYTYIPRHLIDVHEGFEREKGIDDHTPTCTDLYTYPVDVPENTRCTRYIRMIPLMASYPEAVD